MIKSSRVQTHKTTNIQKLDLSRSQIHGKRKDYSIIISGQLAIHVYIYVCICKLRRNYILLQIYHAPKSVATLNVQEIATGF